MAQRHYTTFGEYTLDEVLPFVPDTDRYKVKKVYNNFNVKLSSQRLITFKHNNVCVCCGITGVKILLQATGDQQSPHFNMYAEDNGHDVLMTKDHIIPKSKGGKDELSNYQTMCHRCNETKGSMDINIEQLKELIAIKNSRKSPSEIKQMVLDFLKKHNIENASIIENQLDIEKKGKEEKAIECKKKAC